jgi:hypothetical protein
MSYCGFQWWKKWDHKPAKSTKLRPGKLDATILANQGIIMRTTTGACAIRPNFDHPQVKAYYDFHESRPITMTNCTFAGADINSRAMSANQQVQEPSISKSLTSTNSNVRSIVGDTSLSHNLSDGLSTSRRTNEATTSDEAYSYLEANQKETHQEKQSSSLHARPHDALFVHPNESDANDDNELPP